MLLMLCSSELQASTLQPLVSLELHIPETDAGLPLTVLGSFQTLFSPTVLVVPFSSV